MGCNSCGEQPKRTNKDFTKAVIEIHNPETLVLLRKVIIPVSMGTEEDVPAAIGKYRNVVLVYEANSHVYLYSSDGIPTLISSDSGDIEELIERIEDLEGQDVILHGEIEDVADDLASETTAREQADTALNTAIGAEATAREQADTALNTAIGDETAARQLADTNLQGQIDAITASSDVKDIVGTKAELNNYDTSTLGNNDIIKVLQDESENDATTYYRWNAATEQFTLIGEEGPYYTKSQADTLLNAKQNTLTAGTNVQIVGDTISATNTTYTAGTGLNLNGSQFSVDTSTVATQSDLTNGLAGKQDTLTAGSNVQITGDTISATDTTYTAGNGLSLTGTEFSADTSVLATQTDLADKQNTLTAGTGIDITNDVISATGGGGPTVVQTTGTSTTDVMSQNATTSMVFADPASRWRVQIGAGALASGQYSTAVGGSAVGTKGVALGEGIANADYTMSLGTGQAIVYVGSIGIGYGGYPARRGEVNIGDINGLYGFRNSQYRVLGGLYDGQNAHDAATYGQVLSYAAINGAGAPTTATEGRYVGQLYYDTTNEAMYFLKTIDTTTTPATYTWEALGGGGSGPTVVQTTGTSTTDVMSQDATTKMIYPNYGFQRSKVAIGQNAVASQLYSTALGNEAAASGSSAVAIGTMAQANGTCSLAISSGDNGNWGSRAQKPYDVAIGAQSWTNGTTSNGYSVAIGARSSTTETGEFSIGGNSLGTHGYSGTQYRLLTNVHDPQNAHDAATKGYVDANLPSTFTTNEWNALWA